MKNLKISFKSWQILSKKHMWTKIEEEKKLCEKQQAKLCKTGHRGPDWAGTIRGRAGGRFA